MQQLAQNPSVVSQGETAPTYLINEEYAKPKQDAYKQQVHSYKAKLLLLLNIVAGYFCVGYVLHTTLHPKQFPGYRAESKKS